MPTYEYVCTECGSPLEVVQSIQERSLNECPACGGRLRKVFGNVGVVFKGSGFYRTDNRSKSAKAGSGSSSSATEPAATGAGKSGSGEASKASSPSSSGTGSGSSSAPGSKAQTSSPSGS
jgi:putative FmdB family regulatory protein